MSQGVATTTVKNMRKFYAPGRVNLIGEYTDFNGGLVFPCAIDRGTHLIVTIDSAISGVELSSVYFEHKSTVNIRPDTTPVGKEWINYPLGVMVEFAKLGFNVEGFSFKFSGDLPLSAGLSSSASVSVVTAFAINSIIGANLSNQELALLAQRSENGFINVQCGIMDQFVIAMAQKDFAIALNCDSLEYQQVPFDSGDYRLVIGNTHQPRELKSSAYNNRVAECQAALSILGPLTQSQQLAHVSPSQLQEHLHLLKDPVVANRATHVIEETERVRQATIALEASDLKVFGQLMVQSHQSLRDLFEVSSFTLDCMVDLALQIDGVIGSRMTGAGFGGCTVSLVHDAVVDQFVNQVGAGYKKSTGLDPEFYITTAASGVAELAV